MAEGSGGSSSCWTWRQRTGNRPRISATLCIVNPVAGRRRGSAIWQRVRSLLEARFPCLEARLTTAPGDAERYARDWSTSHPDPTILVVGGDGSIHEVMNGILAAGAATRLGIVPAGTGNDISRNLDLPLDPARAVAAFRPEAPRPVDLGHGDGHAREGAGWSRWFINSISLGVSARANRIAPAVGRMLPGRSRYPVAGVLALAGAGMAGYEIRIGEEILYRDRAINVTFANGAGFGGGLLIAPGSKPDDGAGDLVVIGPMSRLQALGALARLRSGRHLAMRQVYRVSGLTGPVEIRADPGAPVEADGENLPATRSLTVEIIPGRLRVL